MSIGLPRLPNQIQTIDLAPVMLHGTVSIGANGAVSGFAIVGGIQPSSASNPVATCINAALGVYEVTLPYSLPIATHVRGAGIDNPGLYATSGLFNNTQCDLLVQPGSPTVVTLTTTSSGVAVQPTNQLELYWYCMFNANAQAT